ncbi:MAG: mechanosensitive ion channel [Desulfobulbaceae bacterium]|jgi:small conductance mechanosensitive channel|nr:mechanosensitive ion channel [Desulfobulbaceae bacterium]HKJ14541.1 mechanosensitive ion channel domain-containing protein [Desulfobulbales bacterium]MDH3542398.1 mechanosensitive ion channel [Desulfobulbaceae bacterium]MDH3776583.1 mechanosensitive ion channel [Desulfobulbaceae bacterium]MDH3782582.1 mechanosensitive ion channel [Desulfobulbaceae bacterium]
MDINVDALWSWVSAYALNIIGALLIFIVGKWLARRISNLLSKLLEKNNFDLALVSFLTHLTYYALVVLVVVAAAGRLGINTASFLTVIGAAGLAVGLALKDSLSNFAAGVMIVLFRPFTIGDVVSTAGITAKVEKITIFNTHFCSPDNQLIIVPNNKIIADIITNINVKDTRRVDLTVGISYSDDMAETKEILARLAKEDSRILADPAPFIAVAELADSSVNLVFRPWVKTADYWDVRFDLTEKIKNRLDEAGISIPFPQQDVHLFVEKEKAAQVM